MGLIKEKILKNGSTAKYWRVDLYCINKGREGFNFAMLGYASKVIADEYPNEFIDCIGINELMDTEDKTLYKKYFRDKGVTYKDTDTACYCYVKDNVDFFKDAVDDQEEIEMQRTTK